MSDFTKSITYAIVKAETMTAHEAIRAIWDAYEMHDPEPIGSMLAIAIERATSCLAPEFRTPAMPEPVPYRAAQRKPEPVKDDFDDILG